MKCPTCQKDMEEFSEGVTNNGERGKQYKEYKRETYHCEEDDIWISVEIPLITPQHIV